MNCEVQIESKRRKECERKHAQLSRQSEGKKQKVRDRERI